MESPFVALSGAASSSVTAGTPKPILERLAVEVLGKLVPHGSEWQNAGHYHGTLEHKVYG